MATAGFAVGIGNIWRFPYQVGENGGGAFLAVYLTFAILIGIPLFTAEIALGRKSQLSPIAGMRRLTGRRGSVWNLIGWLGVATAFLITSYFMMLLAWIVGYFVMIAGGRFVGAGASEIRALHDGFVARPLPVLGYDLALAVLLAAIVGRGLQEGVERFAKLAMPVLFLMLLGLAARSLTFPGAREGLAWYLTPDVSRLTGAAVLAALGQAFYSIGVGMAGAFGFGSYLDPAGSDVPGSAATVVAFDTGVAVVAGLVIFPALFAFGIALDSGPGLLFVTMPHLFAEMPAGRLFGAAFFFLVGLAAITSAVALMEVLAATLTDSLGLPRRTAVPAVAAVWFVTSIPIVLSQGPWAGWTVGGRDLFALVDWLSGTWLLTVGGLLIALYTAGVWGWERFRDETNVGSGRVRVGATWRPFVQVVIPVAVAVVLLAGLGVFAAVSG